VAVIFSIPVKNMSEKILKRSECRLINIKRSGVV